MGLVGVDAGGGGGDGREEVVVVVVAWLASEDRLPLDRAGNIYIKRHFNVDYTRRTSYDVRPTVYDYVIQCMLLSIKAIVYYVMYSIQCTVCIIQCTLYKM